ncbi:PREDICTED: exosome complex component CSL4 [Rhagoletis zephyria]|uniref:exosome complex component CSL4 n=1 Tax=Rhagoletis zephyria TaxID=28612 RepID=UPI00081147E4|nr:PREDICTED: exosome complex component CSL4 [Rhagoletis zephyria]XP_036317845.1 exosome complex component CSL4 [Rhagoletis pomonella]
MEVLANVSNTCSLVSAEEILCLPGQRICLSEETTVAGQGTYERGGYIYATLAGSVQVREKDKCKYIEVKCAGSQTIVPVAGDVVTARVLQVNQRFAKCSIICIGDHILERTYRGIVRKEDVRATEKDRVEMYKSFRPGDVILARVLPQTELTCYQLSTAENELGVVVATSSESGTNGPPMVPVSWTEMQCPNTLVKEPRKVAKIVAESSLKTELEQEK